MKIIKIMICIIGIVFYAFKIEPNIMVVDRHTIATVREEGKEEKTIKIVQFSDTHLSEHYSIKQLEKVVTRINEEEADIVVFTGDLMDVASRYHDRENIAPILSKIESRYGKFAIWGNHDYGGGGVKYYEEIMKRSGFVLLRNHGYTINIDDQVVGIYGLDDGLLGEPDTTEIMNVINEEEINILLMHEPDLIQEVDDTHIDLALSGHSHGGQVRLPFIGALITPPLSEMHTGGMYTLKSGGAHYVNIGLGTTRIPVRFLTPPTLSVFTIQYN